MTEKIFGKLIVVDRERDPKYKRGNNAMWYCLCECGGFGRYTSCDLLRGRRTHCGCDTGQKRRKYLAGQDFHKLKALYQEKDQLMGGQIRTTWMCQCECGRYRIVPTTELMHSKIKACGKCGPPRRGKRAKAVYEEIKGLCRLNYVKNT